MSEKQQTAVKETASPSGKMETDPRMLRDTNAIADWLMSRGWKPLGPRYMEWTRWQDPTRSLKEVTTKEPIIAQHLDHWDDKKKEYIYVKKQVQVKGPHGQMEPAFHTVVTPAGRSYRIDEAVTIQLEREQLAAEDEARKAG